MEEEIKRSRKRNIIRIGGAVAVLAIVGLIMWLSSIKHLGDEGFFVTNDSQYVIDEEGGVFGTSAVYQVYKHTDDRVTDVTTYYEYEEESTAKEYFEEWQDTIKTYSAASEVKLEGKYIIAIVEKAHYVDWTVDDLKEMYDSNEAMKQEQEERERELEEEHEYELEEEELEELDEEEMVE